VNESSRLAESTLTAYTGARPDIHRMVRTTPTLVLDVGCSDGSLGAIFKASGATVVGVEHDADLAAAARERLDRVLVGDAEEETARLAAAGERFDLVICADVLEHLARPGAVLDHVATLLGGEGRAVVSLPNVRFWTTFTQLGLHGRWPRNDRGVHDRTHLAWFTDSDAREMFAEHGFAVEEMARNTRLSDDPRRRGNGLARYLARGPAKPFLTYQHIYRLEPAPTLGFDSLPAPGA
jgi:2-polyprenyl-3-methyl-5-hydroxy-6-metoxy-1,4-benzoquinol methylase